MDYKNMTAKELYIKETGTKKPSNQIAYSEWYIEYVKWLEKKVEESYKFFSSITKTS